MANNNGYLGNSHLPSLGSVHGYTNEQLAELAKCEDDIQYFAEKYFTIVHVDHGKMKIPLYPYQHKLLNHIKHNRFTAILQCRQSGKCVNHDTYITLRNKKSNEITHMSIGDFYQRESIK